MKFKKTIGLGLAAVAAVSLTACGGGTSTSGKTITVYNQKPEIQKALEDYAAKYKEKSGIEVKVVTCGGTCDYSTKLNAAFTGGEEPELFMIEGKGGYEVNKDRGTDLSSEKWVSDTDYALKYDDKVVAFPLSVEGYGITYNKDILTKAGIDPAGLTNIDAYRKAFDTLNAKKAELGITAPISLAAGPKMEWVMGNHNINAYLSGGLESSDKSVLNDLLAGKVDSDRLTQYGDWVELLFNNADKTMLTTGDYESMVGAFKDGKTAFLHQGNWADPKIAGAGATFDMGVAPAAAFKEDTNQIFIGAAMYWMLNGKSANQDAAKQFLNDLVTSEEGGKFVAEEAGMISPFKSVNAKYKPSAPLTKSVAEWLDKGGAYAWNQNDMPSKFGTDKIGPLFTQFASGGSDKAKFVADLKAQIEAIKA